MRIAFILPSLAQKGPAIVVQDIIRNIADTLHSIDLYYFDNLIELHFNIPIHEIKMNQKIDFHKYDILHSHGYRPNKYVWKHKKHINSIKVCTIHNYMFKDLKFTYGVPIAFISQYVWQVFLRNQDLLVLLSDEMKKYYQSKILLQNIAMKVVHNGRSSKNETLEIPKKEIAILSELSKKFFILGSICVINKIKGLRQVIEVLTLDKSLFFLVIGHGPERNKLEQLAEDLKVSDRILFWGFKENPEVYFNYFDAFIISSYSEGFPLALIEAISKKTPCICSNIPALKNLFDNTEVAFFKIDNIPSLAATINTVKAQKTMLVKNSFQKYRRNYTAERMAENYLTLYKVLISKKKIDRK